MALYVWGSNASHQLGLDVDDKEVYDVRKVDALDGHRIVDCSAGENHSLAVNEFGDVFAWGRGKEGQLGLGANELLVRTPQRITSLESQLIKRVSCGDMHSLALSVSGEVFMWGLLPETRHVQNDGAFDRASVSLTGMMDRRHNAALSPRTLRSSMTDTIMQRLVANSESIYEAANMGDTTSSAQRDGVLGTDATALSDVGRNKVQTVRRIYFVPRVCTSLLRERIIAIAAGFAHSLAVTARGAVFSCGYNDSGQLGTGSRRNAAAFVRVQALDNVAIAHVACGQQHSLASSKLIDVDSDSNDASLSGAVFSWGLGILGQLGTGVHIAWLPVRVPIDAPIQSIAAGSHHSVAVTTDGRVLSWGHSEYGQHGDGELFSDLQRGSHYFVPRLQASLVAQRIVAASVQCSSHSTFVLTADASSTSNSVYAYGWNAFGVLGVGKFQHSVHPQPVNGLRECVVTQMSAGANHAAAIVAPRGAHHSLQYDDLLKRHAFADVAFVVHGARERVQLLQAHRVVVCARSAYVRGLVRAALSASIDPSATSVLVIDAFVDVDAALVQSFLLFLYTHRLTIASHKRQALQAFATRVCHETLAQACSFAWQRTDGRVEAADATDDVTRFGAALRPMVLSPVFADVVFLWPLETVEDGTDACRTKSYARLYAHKCVLSQVEYFYTMFTGGFSEGASASASSQASSSSQMHEIPLLFMHRDGVSLDAFTNLLQWIYTGAFSLLQQPLEPNDLMELFVAAQLLGVTYVARRCELELAAILELLDRASIQACLDFADRFDARRLQTLCRQLLDKDAEERKVGGEEEGVEDVDVEATAQV